MSSIQAVFLDRDGVLNTHLPGRYVENTQQLVVLPGVAQAIRRLNNSGILTIVISNQQGIARGIMTRAALDIVTKELERRLYDEAGAHLDEINYCVHSRHDGCACRKPRPGMILDSLARHGMDAALTVFVGDSGTDIEAAAAAGVGSKALVLTGANRYYDASRFAVLPDFVFRDMNDLVDWVLEEHP
ncbi:MAG: HAD family hydrolase [Capsulimonadaceae bacterium]|nr:HAD family hydrolase [Capsulimonadaceae bacterium]